MFCRKFLFPGCLLFCLGLSSVAFARAAEPNNWYRLNLDSVQGAAIDAALQYLSKYHQKKQKPIIVGIIDSGIDTTVVDLQDALWRNPKEVAGDGKDNDKNGYIDDVHGWNFLGTADGSFNMTSAGTEEYRQFKRLYPKYKNINQVNTADSTEYHYYLQMKKKAGIANYLRMYQFSIIKNKALQTMDSLVRRYAAIDTITINGVMHLQVPDTLWEKAAEKIYADLIRAKTTMKWTQFVRQQNNHLQLMKTRIDGIEHAKDKRLLMGDNLLDETDRFYGNPILTIDGCYHGTFVAGVIAGKGKNGNEIWQGVYPKAKLMIIRAAPDGDEYDKDIASAIHYAVENGAKVINISLGKYTSPTPQMVNNALAYAAQKDVMIVHAAGNNHLNVDSVDYFPTGLDAHGKFYPNFIRVGASTKKGAVSSISNYGKQRVHLFAPGEEITSVVPGNQYATENGTSIAAPIVSGVAALIRSYFPKLKASQVVEILMNSVQPMKNKDASISGGNLHALQAVKLAEKTKRR